MRSVRPRRTHQCAHRRLWHEAQICCPVRPSSPPSWPRNLNVGEAWARARHSSVAAGRLQGTADAQIGSPPEPGSLGRILGTNSGQQGVSRGRLACRSALVDPVIPLHRRFESNRAYQFGRRNKHLAFMPGAFFLAGTHKAGASLRTVLDSHEPGGLLALDGPTGRPMCLQRPLQPAGLRRTTPSPP